MSQFEYITVLTSFVVAVGVSQLLSGGGRLYLNRRTAPPYPHQLAASVLLLVALLQSIWGYWAFRDVSWDFGRFLVVLAPLLPLDFDVDAMLRSDLSDAHTFHPPSGRSYLAECDARTAGVGCLRGPRRRRWQRERCGYPGGNRMPSRRSGAHGPVPGSRKSTASVTQDPMDLQDSKHLHFP